jgi:CPA2 family monovalent cation:H+ antiporter-2
VDEQRFLINVAVALVAAIVGGTLARKLGLPVLVGYLAAGIVVGPYTPGWFADEASVRALADIGVALLVFAVGVQFSLRQLVEVRRIALIGGGAQILATILLGTLLGLALGWGLYGGVFLGCALAHSSTAVMMRILEEGGELGSGHGAAMLSVSIVQDLSLVVMVALLPSLAALTTEGPAILADVAVALLRALIAVGVTLLLALRIVPWILGRMAATGSRELFILVVVTICLLAAYAAQLAGLSLAIGAFLAGLVISESDFAHEAFSQVRPLRDVFASLFFVSIGMLLNPAFVLDHAGAVAAVVAMILVGKALVSAVPVYLAGAHGRTALLAGLGLAQIGEFSYILTAVGIERDLIPEEMSSVILSSSLVTLLASPFLFSAGDRLYRSLNGIPVLSRWLNRPPTSEPAAASEGGIQARVLILGGGRVGRYVSEALEAHGVPHLVVDYDAAAVDQMRDRGVPVVYGDAASQVVLEQAKPEGAELAIVALPEAAVTEMAVRLLKQLAPDLPVVARVHRGMDIPAVRRAGADAAVHAEFEAGTEMIRQGLDRLGLPDPTVDEYIESLRQRWYAQRPT